MCITWVKVHCFKVSNGPKGWFSFEIEWSRELARLLKLIPCFLQEKVPSSAPFYTNSTTVVPVHIGLIELFDAISVFYHSIKFD